MKKVLYFMSMAAAVVFTSCAEDTGTSKEVVDSNADERVNPDHINNYDKPGTAAYVNVPFNGNPDASQGAETPAEDVSAIQIVTTYYTQNNPAKYYNFNSTQYMGGRSGDVNNTMNRDILDTDADTRVDQTPPSTIPGESTDNVMIRNKEERLNPHGDKDN